MDEESITEAEARQFLQELHDKEQKIIEATRGRAGRAEGIKRLLTQLYPDKAHFIYELLQNAEDARASTVSFELERDRLLFFHDGQQLFTTRNVDAITSIDTTKRGDVNQIGKFGVGFKAVYSYTSRPRIYSGPFRFEIRDLFCPFPLYSEPAPFPIDPKRTYFVFPFPGEKKTAEVCFDETAEGLRALDERALLFLNTIQSISWNVAGKETGSVARGKSEGNVISIAKRTGGKTLPESVWLKFDREFDRADGDSLRCSAAFSLKAKEGTPGLLEGVETLRHQWEVVPVDGQAHIYFPAVKEATELKFHVHAPFAAPVDRASVADTDGNRELVGEIGTLVAESLETIKNVGLLDRLFLAVLPNADDEIPEMWNPVFESVVKAFQRQNLLPTTGENSVRATSAIRGERAIRDVISPEDLRFLSGNSEVFWAVGVLENTRESAFLDALRLSKFSWEELVYAIGRNCWRRDNNPKFDGGARWLRGKDGNWLGRFYALLDKAFEETKDDSGVNFPLNLSSIIRLADGSFTSGAERPYFSPTMRLPNGLDFPHVDDSVFDEEKPKQAASARSFLIKVGVKEVNDEEVVKNLVATFYDDSAVEAPDNHLEHIKLFMEWSAKAKRYDVFKEANLFLSSDGILSKPVALYIDEPFAKTGLAALFSPAWQHKHPRRPLWPDYLEKVQAAAFVEFAEQVGVISKIGIVRLHTLWPNHQLYQGWGRVRRNKKTEESREFWIWDLDTWLSKPTLQASLLIWEAMAAEAPETFTARYRPNAFRSYREAPSLLIERLKTTRWIPNRTGEFKRPADLSRGTLHPDFKYDNRNGWLDAIGFGSAAKTEEAEVVARREAAERIGVAPELAEALRGLSSEQQKDWLDRIKASKRKGCDFPDDESPNSQLRSQRAEEQVASAAEVERKQRPRKIRKSSNRPEVREYLSQKYTRDGRLFCQMSQEPVPFALPSGEPYFVAVEVLPLRKEIVANHLCLSPTCAAEFRYALLTDDNDLCARILEVVPEADQTLEVEIEVPLPEHRRIRFRRDHLTDLQAAIRVCGQ